MEALGASQSNMYIFAYVMFMGSYPVWKFHV